ncbi:MAG: hypothetical protein U0T69_00080 [Chitinophagales bacterium]
MQDFCFSIESLINTDKSILWKHITQMKNVNTELMPFAKMTYPKDRNEIGSNNVPLNETLFKSYVLLFGFIPADIHYLKLDKIDFGNAFYENSTSLTHHYWKHTRTLTEKYGKTLVRDEVHFSPRILFLGNIFLPVYKKIFSNRHVQLKKIFK